MLYQLHELRDLFLTPAHTFAEATHTMFTNPFSPITYTDEGRHTAANMEILERLTRRFTKPEFDIDSIQLPNGETVAIEEEVILRNTFCRLLHFNRLVHRSSAKVSCSEDLPKLLLVAPLSGHYATLCRDTVRALLQDHDVYITDWNNAREIPLYLGNFELDDYISYIIQFLTILGPKANVLAVCQPSVPVMAATSIMSANNDPNVPATMTLMGGPIDTRINPTSVNKQAMEKSLDWFNEHIIDTVPIYYPGALRRVCPGFIMLSGFMSMNLERHLDASKSFYNHLIVGDMASASAHRKFYDEYLSVLDMPAEYYLESIRVAFKDHELPKGLMRYKGEKVNPGAITKTALLTIEGELDDISGVGQTKAAHNICKNIPDSMKHAHVHPRVGHYGIFNGKRWRENIMPIVADFIHKNTKADRSKR